MATAAKTAPQKPPMSDAEKAARQEQADKKLQEASTKAYEASRTTPYAGGGSVGSASRRADGIAVKGKTKGKTIAMCGGGRMK